MTHRPWACPMGLTALRLLAFDFSLLAGGGGSGEVAHKPLNPRGEPVGGHDVFSLCE